MEAFMADPIRVLLSQTTFNTDGVTTVWNFSFSGGYLDQTHVKAQRRNTTTGAVTPITLTPAMFTGPYQLTLSPALAVGQELTIYRATPKEGPLVDFTDRAKLTEVSLDYSAKQAIFGVAEADDWRMVVAAAIEAVNVYQAAIATGPVASVNGRTGSVVLVASDIVHTKADVGLANVDNTSDVNKPISTAVAAALVALRGPSFDASRLTNQTVLAGVTTVVAMSNEVADTDGCYNPATYRFTPSRAGHYLIVGSVGIATGSTTTTLLLYKNGVDTARGPQGVNQTTQVTGQIYFNGTTDYVDLRLVVSADATVLGVPNLTYFSGYYLGT